MNGRQVLLQPSLLRQSLAANATLIPRFAVFRVTRMRRVVVNVDRWLVAERHVTDLALDTWRPCLHNTAETIIGYTATSKKRFWTFNTNLCTRFNWDNFYAWRYAVYYKWRKVLKRTDVKIGQATIWVNRQSALKRWWWVCKESLHRCSTSSLSVQQNWRESIVLLLHFY